MLKLFPLLFTMVCSLLFMVPMYLILDVGTSPEMSYFTQKWFYAVCIVPAVIFAAHVVHIRRGMPNKTSVVLALLVPSLVLFTCGNSQHLEAVDWGERLRSEDCDATPQKKALQRAWEAAYYVYSGCLNETSNVHGYAFPTLQEHFRVQDCEEYEAMLHGMGVAATVGRQGGLDTKHREGGYAKEWAYLRALEEKHLCAGWCYYGTQLWGSGTNKDACSAAVADLFLMKAEPQAGEVRVMMLATLCITTVVLITLGPVLRHHGMQW